MLEEVFFLVIKLEDEIIIKIEVIIIWFCKYYWFIYNV